MPEATNFLTPSPSSREAEVSFRFSRRDLGSFSRQVHTGADWFKKPGPETALFIGDHQDVRCSPQLRTLKPVVEIVFGPQDLTPLADASDLPDDLKLRGYASTDFESIVWKPKGIPRVKAEWQGDKWWVTYTGDRDIVHSTYWRCLVRRLPELYPRDYVLTRLQERALAPNPQRRQRMVALWLKWLTERRWDMLPRNLQSSIVDEISATVLVPIAEELLAPRRKHLHRNNWR